MRTINDLINDMQNVEIEVDANQLILDGKLHRLPTRGKTKRIKDAWYVIHTTIKNNYVAIYQNYRQTEIIKWYSSSHQTANETKLMQNICIKAAEDNALYKPSMLKDMRTKYNNAPLLTFEHNYLIKKQITEILNMPLKYKLRADGNGNLVIPLFNMQYDVMGFQQISVDGEKYFSRGTQKQGNFFPIIKDDLTISSCSRIHIGEGLATMVSLAMALETDNNHYCYIVAFDVGNIAAVYQQIRSVHPKHVIVLVADNDCGSDINIGVNTCKKIEAQNKYDNKLIIYIPSERI